MIQLLRNTNDYLAKWKNFIKTKLYSLTNSTKENQKLFFVITLVYFVE